MINHRQLNERIAAIAVPSRMQHLPISATGFPVPWFVDKLDGEYDFRAIDFEKLQRAVRQRLCWLCGQTLGARLAFVIGPMCAVNRVTSEPPSHRECAEYAVKACPFLTQPRARRNTKGIAELVATGEAKQPAGFAFDRNPGVAMLYMTRTFRPFRPHAGKAGILFRLGPAEAVVCYREGRPATRAEVLESIDSGMPLLRRLDYGDAAQRHLDAQYKEALRLLPAA
jgi:hypothetical protein